MLSGVFHLSSALRAGLVVPWLYAVAATVQADSSDKSAERWCRVAYDSADNQRLDGLAVGTTHALDVLTHEAAPFIVVGFIAAFSATICLSLCQGK